MILKNMLARALAFSLAALLVSLPLHASSPLWTFSAPTPARALVSEGETTTVQYTVTNRSHKPKKLLMQSIPGVQASNCELAGRGSTCILTLTISGSKITRKGLNEGPVLCHRGNINQCYRPSQRNFFRVDKGYAIGGTVSNLYGTVVLENSNGDVLSINTNGSFVFPKILYSKAIYNVTIKTQPTAQTCVVSNGRGTIKRDDVNDVEITCYQTTLKVSTSHLALSVTGLEEQGFPTFGESTDSGRERIITITNQGAYPTENLFISASSLPSGTEIVHNCSGTIPVGQSCTLTIKPGSTATSDVDGNECSSGTIPIPAVIGLTADNANTVFIEVVVLNYGCVYQGGYVFALNDTKGCEDELCANSVGGKVVAMEDQGNAKWSTTQESIWGIGYGSTESAPQPNEATGGGHDAEQLEGQEACLGKVDGSCNSENIIIFYSEPNKDPAVDLSEYAAGICRSYQVGGFNNWYLPATCELIGDNDNGCNGVSGICSNIPSLCGGGCLLGSSCLIMDDYYYKSSSQANANFTTSNTSMRSPTTGGASNKLDEELLRCVRTF